MSSNHDRNEVEMTGEYKPHQEAIRVQDDLGHTEGVKRRVLVIILTCFGLLLILQGTGCLQLERWLSPKSVTTQEAYLDKPSGPKVDHSTLDAVLRRFVTEQGQVNYELLRSSPEGLDRYITELAQVAFGPLPRDEKLALLINAYNAFTLRLILDHWPVESIRDIPKDKRWAAKRWGIGSIQLSLDEIEHEYLRKNFKEPRIHFAINCASLSCPPLRREAYQAAKISQQLQDQAVRLHSDPGSCDLDSASQKLRLTRLYLWFEGDFEQASGSSLAFAAQFHPGLASVLKKSEPSIEWIEFDWRLNAAR